MTTTLTPPAPAPTEALTSGSAPGGLVRTMLRLHNWALWVWTGYVALGAGLLIWAWGPAAGELRSTLAACSRGGSAVNPGCGQELSVSLDVYETFLRFGFWLVLLAPFLVVAWAAASLTARELETGTARLAWTQSVTPVRWLTATLTVPAVAVTSGMTLLLALYRIAHLRAASAVAEVRHATPYWWNTDFWSALGVVMIPRVLCAVAVGVLLGLVLKRSLPALGAGLLLTGLGTAALMAGRRLLLPAEIRHGYRAGGPSPQWYTADDEWPVDSGAVTDSGRLVGYDHDCLDVADPPGKENDVYACLEADGYRDLWASYHPKAHFWPLQLVESGIWLAVAALAVCLSYRVLRRRTA